MKSNLKRLTLKALRLDRKLLLACVRDNKDFIQSNENRSAFTSNKHKGSRNKIIIFIVNGQAEKPVHISRITGSIQLEEIERENISSFLLFTVSYNFQQ